MTAVNDFWSRRWNLTVSAVLRDAVYDLIMEGEQHFALFGALANLMACFCAANLAPCKRATYPSEGRSAQCTHVPPPPCTVPAPVGRLMRRPGHTAHFSRTRRLAAVLAVFVCSGLMHEALFWWAPHAPMDYSFVRTLRAPCVMRLQLHSLAVHACQSTPA